ncbi:unnamed protein product [Anisakis simplex]|uniref:Protein S-acyltransferase n=1 Tax=Anisakis simplex TaxID=6269 RepID=A0A0M3JZV4_ANISI|nr:unnamed protein product [Anisakis simplex]
MFFCFSISSVEGVRSYLISFSFQALCFLFYGLLLVVIASEYLIILPYENYMRPSFLIPIYYVTGLYLIINILYHYWKVCTVDPGKPESVSYTYLFRALDYFQLLSNPQMVPFCVQPIEMVPWRKWMCENMADFVNGCVCFDYGLAILLVLVLGGLAAFNIYMISIGETLIDYLQDADERRSQRNWRSSNDIGLKLNWLRFLGLKKGRSFWRYILLPSSHKPLFEYYSSYLRHDPTHIV